MDIEGVWGPPCNLVFGDMDGMLVIPKKVGQQVAINALKKVRREKVVRKEIENGMTVTEAF